MRPLVRVVEHCVRRPIGGADNILECGHRVLFTGVRPERQRCPECPPLIEWSATAEPTLFEETPDA